MRKIVLACASLLSLAGTAGAHEEWRAGPVFRGVEVQIHLPDGARVRNIPAPRDRLGLCVFAAHQTCAYWMNIRELGDLIHQIPYGGGTPEKLERIHKEHAPNVELVQYQGTDPSMIELALRTRRPVGHTYGYGEFYRKLGMPWVAHAVTGVHLDPDLGAITDNNDPEVNTWMSREEFLSRWTHLGGYGWAYVMIGPPPPPPLKFAFRHKLGTDPSTSTARIAARRDVATRERRLALVPRTRRLISA